MVTTESEPLESFRSRTFDAVVVGSGPNGLAAGIALAREGLSVGLIEASDEIGGGSRTAQLTLPDFLHDVCSAIHPMAASSSFFDQLPLADHRLRWIHPAAPLAHPLDDGTAVMLERSVNDTLGSIGTAEIGYGHVMRGLERDWPALAAEFLGPPLHVPRHPLVMARFGLKALQSAHGFAERHLTTPRATALYGGLAAHSFLPFHRPASAAIGLMLGAAAHSVGWPLPAGGAAAIPRALAAHFTSLGGSIQTGWRIERFEELPRASAYLFDVTPRQLLRIAAHQLSSPERRRLARYQYGPGVFKVDWALSGPVPWAAPECVRAGTVHLGGTMQEVAAGEAAIWRGEHPERPFVLIAQQSLFDPARAPEGKHTLWGYCHVPSGSTVNMTERIEAQVERFAPGFRDLILERHVMNSRDFERYNPNYIGGDINGGAANLLQVLFRPTRRFPPYATSNPRIYLCSSSTPPGGGVHGMCGFHAARIVLGRWSRIQSL